MAVAHRETTEVQSVTRAMAVLDAFDRDSPTLGVGELARRTGLHVSTVSRLLATLERGGLVSRTPAGRYALGLRLVGLAALVAPAASLREAARPTLEALRNHTGETANLLALDGRHAVYLDQVESPHPLRHAGWDGRRIALDGTAAGAALRDPGPAHACRDAVEAGVTAVAAGLVPPSGPPVAVGVTGPTSRLRGAALRSARDAVTEAATELGLLLARREAAAPSSHPVRRSST
jgi:DNA-binding IclR family transcriptional regulator